MEGLWRLRGSAAFGIRFCGNFGRRTWEMKQAMIATLIERSLMTSGDIPWPQSSQLLGRMHFPLRNPCDQLVV